KIEGQVTRGSITIMTWPQDEHRVGSRCNSEQCMGRTVAQEHCRVCQQQLEQQAYHEEERQYQQLLEQRYRSSLPRQQHQQHQHQHQQELLRRHQQQQQQLQQHQQHQQQQELLRRHQQQRQQQQQHQQQMMVMAMNGDRSGDRYENFDDNDHDDDHDDEEEYNDGTCGDRNCAFCCGREQRQSNYSTSCRLDGDEDDSGGPGASLGGVSSSVCTASTGTMSWYTQDRGSYE
ncbi:unnamed protein product, partial [Ectocarpus sp. 13 AM-2016]